MPTPIREQILQAITDAVGGEYYADIPEDERDLPLTSVVDGEDEAATDAYGVTNVTTLVQVVRAQKADSREKSDMRAQCNGILADMVVELSSDSATKALVDGIDYISGAIVPESDGCSGIASFNIRWHHVAGDPYTIDET